MKNVARNMIKSKISFDLKTFALTKSTEFFLSYSPITAIPALKIGHLSAAIAVMPQLHIWNVPPLPRPSASAPPATAGPLAVTAVGDTYI